MTDTRVRDKQVPLRFVVTDPEPGVVFALQRGRSELVAPTRSSGDPITFDLDVVARMGEVGEPPRFLGPFTQGPVSERFVYVNSGTLAGDDESRWTRRAKVMLVGIAPELLERVAATPGARLTATIPGRAPDGGPVCSRVDRLEWTLQRQER